MTDLFEAPKLAGKNTPRFFCKKCGTRRRDVFVCLLKHIFPPSLGNPSMNGLIRVCNLSSQMIQIFGLTPSSYFPPSFFSNSPYNSRVVLWESIMPAALLDQPRLPLRSLPLFQRPFLRPNLHITPEGVSNRRLCPGIPSPGDAQASPLQGSANVYNFWVASTSKEIPNQL